MKRVINRTATAAAVIGIAATFFCSGSVFAAAGNGVNYTPVAGTSATFNKYLIMDAGDNVPSVSFAFTVTPGSARSADTSDNTVMEVTPGVGSPVIANVTFAPTDATATTVGTNIDIARTAAERAAGLTAATGVQFEPASGEKYATKQATVDFSSVTFTEPGIYRYVITETASAADEAAGIMHDNDTDRILDVYVTDDGTGTLAVSAYVLHTDDDDVVINNTMGSADVAAAGEALDDKTDGFTNEYNSKDLKFTKEVTGNQASRDKYFKFTVTATNINDADKYTVSLADDNNANTTDGAASAVSGTNAATKSTYRSQNNPTEVTGTQLKAGVYFYLAHGQSIAIRGLAPNAGYSVTEDAEDYKSTGASVTGYTDAVSGTIGTVSGTNKAVLTSYKNQRDGIIPTGVIVTIIPGVAVVCAVLAVFILLRVRRRKNNIAR